MYPPGPLDLSNVCLPVQPPWEWRRKEHMAPGGGGSSGTRGWRRLLYNPQEDRRRRRDGGDLAHVMIDLLDSFSHPTIFAL